MVPQNNGVKCFLPENYVPSEFDVMCGRGVECFRHSGNVIFRQTVDNSLNRYATALSKQKSIVVQDVITHIRSKSSEPAKFIRLCHQLNCWFEITDDTIRQKVSQTLREALIQRDPEKRKLYNKKRAEKRATRLAANSPGSQELAISAPAHAKQLQQLTASQETPSLFRLAAFPCFQYTPAPASLLTMPTLPTHLDQASLVDLVDETLGCIRQEASLVDPFEETLECIHLAFPGRMSSENWFTVGDVVGNDCGDSDLSSVFW